MLWPSHLLITIWPHQSLSDPYTSQLLLLPTHQLKVLTVHLLATIFHPLIGAVVTRYCYLRHLSVVLRLWLIVYMYRILYMHTTLYYLIVNLLTLAHFSCYQHIKLRELILHLLSNISHHLTGAMVRRYNNVIHFTWFCKYTNRGHLYKAEIAYYAIFVR